MNDHIISGAEPFFLPASSKQGVLLIHGFTGNPAEMFLLGQHLHQYNFSVLAVRLAGHSTNEADLARMSHFDWFASVLDGFYLLSNFCNKVSVVGHSMGGLLALQLASSDDVSINKIVSLAAPIFIHPSLNIHLLPPIEHSLDKFVRKPRRLLSDVPPAVNLTYRLMPLISIHRLLELIDLVKSSLVKVSIPSLIVHGDNDRTASPMSANFIFEHISSNVKLFKSIPNAGHLLPIDSACRDSVFHLISDFLV